MSPREDLALIELASASDVGRQRSDNQDRDLLAPPIIAVADGMGGHLGGGTAAAMAVDALRGVGHATDPTALLGALKDANRAIARAASDDPGLAGMGTTATAALLEGGILYLVHVGDSRAYLIRGGRIIQVTDDHSVVAEMVRRGALSADAAETHPARHVITRALGVDADLQIDALRVDLEPGDVVLLCTDGLSGPVGDEQIREAVEEAATLEDAAAALVDRANAAGGPDNVTVVLARVDAVTREAAATG
ncbi:MAG: Stp1/IreP family PP2C-type Ser/Thr phosphatase [Thermoleophilia bacterium]|nr:Stp1/IreP family PP2C-type Ser/Thr phosphatase [Thermoleophilia bacterium]